MKGIISIRIAAAAVLALLTASAIYGEKSTSGRNGREMARHFFMKGAIKEASGSNDAAYEYYKKAYAADPSYVDGAFSFGSMRMVLDHDTLGSIEEKEKALALTRSITEAYPGDIQSGIHYTYLAMSLDKATEALRVLNTLERLHPNESMLQAYKANAYATIGEIDSAIYAIKKYERLEGMSFETTLQKVRYHLAVNDTVGAIGELTELIAINPGKAEYVAYKAKVFDMLQMPDSAFLYFNKALEVNPSDGFVKNELAQLYAQRGDSVAYDNLTTEALLSDDLAFETKLQILAKYLQRMVNDKADTKRSDLIFEKLREQYPHEPEMLDLGARYSAAKHDYKEALRQIDYAIALDGQNPDYLEPKMSYLLLDNQAGEAMKIYEEALRENRPTSMAASMIYISSAQEMKRHDRAIATLDSLVNLMAPGLSIADSTVDLRKVRNLEFVQLYLVSSYYQMAGDVYYNTDDLPDAFRSYANAIALFPDNALALNNYAYFLVEKGGYGPGTPEFDKAKEMSLRSIEISNEEPESTYLDTYAWILFLEKNYAEAEKYQEQAVEAAGANPKDSELFSHYGDILYMNGKPEEALEQWKKALELDPENALLKKKVTHKTFFYE